MAASFRHWVKIECSPVAPCFMCSLFLNGQIRVEDVWSFSFKFVSNFDFKFRHNSDEGSHDALRWDPPPANGSALCLMRPFCCPPCSCPYAVLTENDPKKQYFGGRWGVSIQCVHTQFLATLGKSYSNPGMKPILAWTLIPHCLPTSQRTNFRRINRCCVNIEYFC